LNTTGIFCGQYAKEGKCKKGKECRNVHYSDIEGGGEDMVEDQEEMAARVEELIKMVKAGKGDLGDSDEEDDDDVEIVRASAAAGME
jgi:hypothetical protein